MLNLSRNKETKTEVRKAKRAIFQAPLVKDLNYEEILPDGTIVYTDGSVGLAYELVSLYLDSLTDEAIMHTERQLSSAISMLDGRKDMSLQIVWMKTSTYDVLDSYKRQITSRDDNLMKLSGSRINFWRDKIDSREIYELKSVIFIRRFVNRKFGMPKLGINMTDKVAEMAHEHRRIMSDVRADIGRLVRSMESLKPRLLSGDEIVTIIFRSIYGNVSVPRYDRLKEPARNFFCGRDIELQRQYGYITVGDSGRNIAVLSMHSLPPVSWMRMMAYMAVIDCPVRVSMYIKPMNTAATKSKMELKLRRAANYSSVFSAKSRMICEEIEQIQVDLENGSRLVEIESYVAVEGRSAKELGENIQIVKAKAQEFEAAFVDEHVALWPCWLNTLPAYCSPGETDRNFVVKTENAVDLMPLLGGKEPDRTGQVILRGPCSSITSWDIFNPSLPAHHGLIFGSTGSGKSFFTSLMILSSMIQEPLVYIVDKGGSYRRLTKLLNGKYLEVASGKMTINPFEIPESFESEPEKRIPFFTRVLEVMTAVGNDRESEYETAILERLAQALVQTWKNNRDNGNKRAVTISDAYSILDGYKLYDYEKDGKQLAEPQQRLKIILGKWSVAGTKGTSYHCKLLDNPNTSLDIQDSQLVAFDMNGIEAYPDIMRVVFLVISDLIRRRCQQEVSRKKLVVFDEVWSVLKTREGAIFLEELYRTMRKYNAAVFSISQDIADFSESEIARAIMSNVKQKIILRQSSEHSRQAVQKALGLTEAEMWLINQIKNRKGEFSECILAIEGNPAVKVGIVPSPEELWMATTDANDVALFESLVKQGYGYMDAVFSLAEKYPRGAKN